MSRAIATIATLALASLVAPGGERQAQSFPTEDTTVAVADGFGRLPLRFERNDGQAAERVRYLARGPGYTMFVTPTEMVLSLRKEAEPQSGGESRRSGAAALRVKLLDGRPGAELEALEELPGKSNYFIGNDPKKWRRGVPGYAKVRCRDVYPGIDLVYYGRQRQLEYDFVVAPGADPGRIRLGFEGARGLRLDGEGNLVVAVEGGEVVQRAPRVYQKEGPSERAVHGRWALRGANEARFELGAYDTKRLLVIDPVLNYSTYLGGNDLEIGFGIAVDGSGSAYLAGVTRSTNFPTANPYQTDLASDDVFVAKLSPSGDSLVYSTYLGGSASDVGSAIAVDGSGSAYVTGYTLSTDFPTQNPYQTDQGSSDTFVTKLAPSGNSLVYSTYLGGSSGDGASGIAVDGSGSAYVAGSTISTDFPTHDPYQTDQAGDDAFLTKFSPSGDSLVYSTYLGGSSIDRADGIAVDTSGSAYVIGLTVSTDFPTQNPHQPYRGGGDAFVTKLAPSGNSLVYSTYLGGSAQDHGHAIAVDGSGSAYVTGETYSTDFPTKNPCQANQGFTDVFVTKLSPWGDGLEYSTYLGGSSNDGAEGIAVDPSGSAYVIGRTVSTDFPTQDPHQPYRGGSDAFVVKLGPPPPTGFFTVSPCRLIDTRNPAGPHGGPALAAGTNRTFTLAGQCDISPKARSVSVNVAVTQPTAGGHLRLYPAGGALPLTSSLNYSAGQTRSNNAIVLLTSGGITVRCTQPSGTAHFILDVNGYFE